jgi:hypothetical protein
MATVPLQRARVYGTISGNSPQIRYFPEADEQSFKTGQFVYLASGKVTACASDPAAILGMAAHDASGNEDEDVAVHVINGDTEFEVNVYFDGDGDEDDQIEITSIGNAYGMIVSNNKCYCDISDTTNKVFIVKSISVRDNAGDVYGRAVVDVIPSVSQLHNDEIQIIVGGD